MSTAAGAQPVSFIHLQTENDQPYALEWNGAKYVSSATGYLLIPQVPAGKHVLTMDYTDEAGSSASHRFSVEITDKPRGFSLRQGIDNSWSLFDLTDLSLTEGVYVQPVVKTVIPDKITEPIQVVHKETKPAATLPAVKKEPVIVKEKTIVIPTAIQKIFDKAGSAGIDQVYVLTVGTRSDTIALFIPSLAEKNEPVSNPSAWQQPRSSHINTPDKALFTRQRNPESLSK